MATVIWTKGALLGLEEIAEFIALDKPMAAVNLADQVVEAAKQLEEFPNSGRMVPEFGDPDIRELIVGPCRVLYQFDPLDRSRLIIPLVIRGEQRLWQGLLP